MSSDSGSSAWRKPLRSFSQEDINAGNVQYVNLRFSPQADAFILDLSNGFKSVDGLTVVVDIIPDRISLETQNISVREGDARALSEDDLNISNYANSLNFKCYILKGPEHGRIANQQFPEDSLSFFTMKEVRFQWMRMSSNVVLVDFTSAFSVLGTHNVDADIYFLFVLMI